MDFSFDSIMGSVGGAGGILAEGRGFLDSYLNNRLAKDQLKTSKEVEMYSRSLDYQTSQDTLEAQIRLKSLEESTKVKGIDTGSGVTKYVTTALAIAGVMAIGIFAFSYRK